MSKQPQPPTPLPPVKGVVEQEVKDNAPQEGDVIVKQKEQVEIEPLATPSIKHSVILRTTTAIVTREVVARKHIYKDRYASNIAAGKTIHIPANRIFYSRQELANTGLSPEAIDHCLRNGSIVARTIDNMHAKGMERSAITMGNTTGDPEKDARIGKIYADNPGAKWGRNPQRISGWTLSKLQAEIAMIDPGRDIPDTSSECIRILSSEFSN